MTPIEQQTYGDGFRLGLLCTRLEPRRPLTDIHAVVFDGGRPLEEFVRTSPGLPPAQDYLALRRFLAPLAPEPHVLVGYGLGWRGLLADTLVEHLPAYRILDLKRAAIRLSDRLPPAADDDALGRAYGISWRDEQQGLTHPWATELLWATLAAAGRQGLDWRALLRASGQEAFQVGFDRYGFDEATLRTAPLEPGVYVMRDRGGGVLYVGKAASLQRRLQDYFRASPAIPAKLQTLRDRIHDLELRPVGSEIEAILLEQRWITELEPLVNTQRTVAEGGSRYAAPVGPVLMIMPSTQAGCVELFGFARARPGVQLRLRLSRPARGTLAATLNMLSGTRRTLPHRPHLVDWGMEGSELMTRYFGRARDRIAWLEVRGDGTPVDAILSAARVVLTEPPEATEFRD